MTCRRCGDAISADRSPSGDDASASGSELCFFCTPASWDAASDLSKIVGDKRAKSAFETDNERIGAIDDADWERPEPAGVDEVDIDLTKVKSAPTDYFAALDEPDDFDEKAWLEAIGSDLAEADRVKLGWDVPDATPADALDDRGGNDVELGDDDTEATEPELVSAGRRRFFGRRG